MKYEWDPDKNQSNQRKHEGISFEVALEVFEDERCIFELDRVDEFGEERWKAIGVLLTRTNVLTTLVVIHVLRVDIDGDEIIRIISAREADPRERRLYQEQETY